MANTVVRQDPVARLPVIDKRRVRYWLYRPFEDPEEMVAAAKSAVDRCDFDAMRTALKKLERLEPRSEPVVAMQAILSQEIVADAAYARAMAHYDAGELEQSLSALQAAGLTACRSRRDEVSENSKVISGIRSTIEALGAAVESCDPETIMPLRKVTPDMGQPALRGALEAFDRMVEKAEPFVRAKTYYFEGRLDEARAQLDKVDTEACPTLVPKIAQRRKKIERLGRVVKAIDETIASCDLAAAKKLRRDVAASIHRLLKERSSALQRMISALKTVRKEHDAAEAAYQSGALDAATRALDKSLAALERIGRNSCPGSRETIGDRYGKIDRMRRVLKQADETIARCHEGELGTLKTRLSGKSHRLLKKKTREVNAALKRCAKPRLSAAEQARRACRRQLGEGASAVSRGGDRFDCACRSGFFMSRDNSSCLTREQAASAGEKHCAATIPGSRLESIKPSGAFQCACPTARYFNRFSNECIDWDGVIAHGKKLCARDGQVLGHVKGFNDYLCCDRDTPNYDASDNKCHKLSASDRAANRERQAAQERKRRQRKDDAQKVVEGLTGIIETIQSSRNKGRDTRPDWPNASGGGSGSGNGSSSARCQSLAQEAQRHSSRMQSIMSRYRGQRDLACEILRMGEQQKDLLRRMQRAGCGGTASLPNMNYPAFRGCN